MEALELAVFMVAACLVVALLEHPDSAVRAMVPDPLVRRVLTGVAMGLTAIAIIYSPFGQQSGAHFNPSVTLTFWRLGRIPGWDALFYVAAQFAGGIAGVLVAGLLLGGRIEHPSVNYVATLPGAAGVSVAFGAEFAISFGIMTVVLRASNLPRLAPFTGLLCGLLVAVYISAEAPLSGMSMNPARSFGPAAVGHVWTALWIYFLAPPVGMLLAAEVHLRTFHQVACAKLQHDNPRRCIFCRSRQQADQ